MHVYNTLIYVSLLHPESSVLACDSITMREVSKVEEEDAAFNAPLRAVPWPAVVPNLGWVHTADVYSLVLDQFKARMSLPVAVDAFCPFSNCNALFFLPFALSLSVQAAFSCCPFVGAGVRILLLVYTRLNDWCSLLAQLSNALIPVMFPYRLWMCAVVTASRIHVCNNWDVVAPWQQNELSGA
eukprot:scaffold110615_cov20-Tisochrysis_lutea.AAC.1